jgi:hypothetical protein
MASSLRGGVCNVLSLLGLASIVSVESESHGTQDRILLIFSQFLRLPQPGGPGPRIYIPQGQGGPVIPPGTGFPLRRLCLKVAVMFPWAPYLKDGSTVCNAITQWFELRRTRNHT